MHATAHTITPSAPYGSQWPKTDMREPRDIPNGDGFKLYTFDAKVNPQPGTVKKREDGTHYVADLDGERIEFSTIQGWIKR